MHMHDKVQQVIYNHLPSWSLYDQSLPLTTFAFGYIPTDFNDVLEARGGISTLKKII